MLSQYLRRRVSVVTVDGRYLVGVLHAADQLMNLVLTSCAERVFDDEAEDSNDPNDIKNNRNGTNGATPPGGEMREHSLGVLMIRGSDVVCVASVNTVEEAKLSRKLWRGRNLPVVERVARSATASVKGG
ncbi:U6 snRNA-associated Sm-like protein LSm8p [Trypanosoma brucei gambiense DAL972]|uniref:U6 snRNA-associated Sm-like protein LSm8p n=1 Tax=Trypanosoma brucei gambiense (strain MHOM/CI/86/DAL972) TaxID=679716 RepID=C9ZK60_TRYB9|nr:U6 snRNA-associated Sm-like protein LSm8p [Trypanosoma brucei gambiense DAL972]CBH09824.1 U6 snRNA-associated Sm-like protein LSm8p [Trypanosoma brucei gambiense DAL972]|eukprot:XP_011772117.1 U6 snRNA-associated Sm-like protein LSm8p [Trypanosoma brucei gambiense DAL972]